MYNSVESVEEKSGLIAKIARSLYQYIGLDSLWGLGYERRRKWINSNCHCRIEKAGIHDNHRNSQ